MTHCHIQFTGGSKLKPPNTNANITTYELPMSLHVFLLYRFPAPNDKF